MVVMFNVPSALYGATASFVLFRVLHWQACRRLPVPSSLKHFEGRTLKRKLWKYRNIALSFFHSTVTAIGSVLCFFDEPRMLSDMINTRTTMSHVLVAFSLGYFFHDFIDVVMNDFSQQMGLVLHHVVVCGAFGLALFGNIYHGFAACSLLMEVSSIFLHSRRILMFNGFSKKSLPFKLNGLLLLLTFIFFRFLTSAWMTNFVITNREVMPFMHFVHGAINMAIITVINIILLMTICKSDLKKEKQSKQDE